jgi:hypothetical protein
MHHDYYEKKCHEINRELKRTGTKLLGISSEVYQGGKLLTEANHQIVLFNLARLNRKYREAEEEGEKGACQ